MLKSDFYFDLPENLIAQTPLTKRDESRLLQLNRATGEICDGKFYDIASQLRRGDLLVLNNSKVLPARLLGQKIPHGAAIEFLLLEQKSSDTWEILVRPGRKATVGSRFTFGGGILVGEIVKALDDGNRLARFEYTGSFFDVLEQVGNMPLPPYITEALADKNRYQTVYAKEIGSSAAPTAGLHFTPELIEKLRTNGINIAYVTLHVGLGTFRPVKAENIADHKMHEEHYHIPKETAELIRETKQNGGRVVAVGTTSCRTLESAAQCGEIHETTGRTDIFITPGYKFKVLDGLITNFHLPESTLIMLVSAFAGYDDTMKAYKHAVNEGYRFFSFGDAMCIL